MKEIYDAFKDHSKNKLITNGIGTGYSEQFDVRNIATTVDYLSPHSYPFFHGTYTIGSMVWAKKHLQSQFYYKLV